MESSSKEAAQQYDPAQGYPEPEPGSAAAGILALLPSPNRVDRQHEALSAEQLLESGRETLERWFHRAPLGPIPAHLQPHHRVFGCVSEYEEALEEQDRWKIRALDSWLQERVGKTFRSGGHAVQLCSRQSEPTGTQSYRLEWLDNVD